MSWDHRYDEDMKNLEVLSRVSANSSRSLINEGLRFAEDIGLAVSITILDESGNLMAFGRNDLAPLISIETSRKKAIYGCWVWNSHRGYLAEFY